MPAEVEIRIKNGKISVDVAGVEGNSCEDITRALVDSFGEVDGVTRKPEYFVELDALEQKIFEDE